MSMIKHFDRECELLGWNDLEGDDAEMQQMIMNNVKDVLAVISKQGHSGFSMGYFKSLLNKAMSFDPLAPLTGEDSEWNDVDGEMYQNIRCSSVFKDKGGAYDIDRIVLREPDGACFTRGGGGIQSKRMITFPYTPETFYVDIPKDATDEQIEESMSKVDTK